MRTNRVDRREHERRKNPDRRQQADRRKVDRGMPDRRQEDRRKEARRQEDKEEKRFDDQIEGRNSVLELLESGKDINKIYVTRGERHGSINKILGIAKERKIIVVEKDKRQMVVLLQLLLDNFLLVPFHPFVFYLFLLLLFLFLLLLLLFY